MESVGSAHRAIVTVGQDLGWCIGVAVTPLVTYHVRDWVWIQRSVVIPELFFLYLALSVDPLDSEAEILCGWIDSFDVQT